MANELQSLEQALGAILADVFASDVSEEMALIDAFGRTLARPIVAEVDVPPWDNSAMDGYAVNVSDVVPGEPLPVSQRIPAGEIAQPLAPKTVARIFTGAPIPGR